MKVIKILVSFRSLEISCLIETASRPLRVGGGREQSRWAGCKSLPRSWRVVGVQEEEDPEAAQEDPRAREVAGGDYDQKWGPETSRQF